MKFSRGDDVPLFPGRMAHCAELSPEVDPQPRTKIFKFCSIAVKPYFTMEPEDVTVQSGDDVRFVCEVAGDPEPVVVCKY